MRNIVVWAAVDSRRGHPRTDLELQDFQIYEDGVRQSIADFALGSETPLTVQILVDASKSMEISGMMELAKRAAHYLVARLGAKDQASFWFFAGRRTHRDCELGTPLEEIQDSLLALRGHGETTLRDSVFESLLSQKAVPLSRRAVFLFTDGKDNASTTTPEELAALAGSLNVPIHAIILSPVPEKEADLPDLDSFRAIVDLSGGHLVIVDPFDPKGPVDAINQALGRLRSSYVLEYSPEGTGRRGFHRIEVKARCRHCKVIHRQGYYTE